MYEKFTDRARKVMMLANEEAHRFNHEYIGTEHILLGLIREGSGVAANVLKNFGVDLRKLRLEVEKLVERGPDMVTLGKAPQTPRAKKVVEYAMSESRDLGHNYVGTEHLLLGLSREDQGVASQVLTNLGLQLEQIRAETIRLVTPGRIPPAAFAAPNPFQRLLRRLFEKNDSFVPSPKIQKKEATGQQLVAVDIGNSQIKLGQFTRREQAAGNQRTSTDRQPLPEPLSTLSLPTLHETGLFDLQSLATWCEKQLSTDTVWLIGSVHRGAAELLTTTIAAWAKHLRINWSVRQLTNADVPISIQVDEPARVGVDRLLAAVAANRLRAPDCAAIVIDLGTAITVDLVEADGAFAGGAILPGIGMAGRALADQTDALPYVMLESSAAPPSPTGKSTKAAIEAGLYWGTRGAVGELVSQISKGLPAPPDIFITGGAGRTVADAMPVNDRVRYVPHLVLSGIALVDQHLGRGQVAN